MCYDLHAHTRTGVNNIKKMQQHFQILYFYVSTQQYTCPRTPAHSDPHSCTYQSESPHRALNKKCTKTLKSYVCTHQPSNTHAPAHIFSPTLPQISVGNTTPSARQKMVAIQQTWLCIDQQHTCPCTPPHSDPHSTHISRKLHTVSSTKNGRQPTNVRVCVDKYCILWPSSSTFALLLTFALILTN